MKKNILLTCAGLAAVIVLIGGIKALQIGTMIGQKRPVLTETVTVSVPRPLGGRASTLTMSKVIAFRKDV